MKRTAGGRLILLLGASSDVFTLTDENASRKALSLLDSALEAGETSASHGYSVRFSLAGGYCDVVFNRPVSYVIDDSLNQRILKILTAGFFPFLTFYPVPGLEMVQTGDKSFAKAMALRFRFKVGNFKRLHFKKLSDVSCESDLKIPLMRGYFFDVLASSGMCALSGPSGSGKTSLALYLLQAMYSVGATIKIIDPKLDVSLFRFANKRGLVYVTPEANSNEYFNSVLNTLKEAVDEIHRRQLSSLNGHFEKKPLVIFVDEAMALTSSISDSKKVKDYLAQISQITLQGRSARVFLWLGAQTFSASGSDVVMSSSSRDQMALKIVLSQAQSDWRYLFKDIDLSSLVLVRDEFSKGLGVASVMPDGRVVPFLAPKVDDLEG